MVYERGKLRCDIDKIEKFRCKIDFVFCKYIYCKLYINK